MGLFTGERFHKEATVEGHLRKVVKAMRGYCIKLYLRGWPDRLVLLPGGRAVFVELKRPVGGKFEPLQERTHAKLRTLGFEVLVLNTKRSIDETFQGANDAERQSKRRDQRRDRSTHAEPPASLSPRDAPSTGRAGRAGHTRWSYLLDGKGMVK